MSKFLIDDMPEYRGLFKLLVEKILKETSLVQQSGIRIPLAILPKFSLPALSGLSRREEFRCIKIRFSDMSGPV